MSFLLDRKREHEKSATDAVRKCDFSQAFFHATQVAELGLQLAEQADGRIAEKYAEDANGWIGIARQLKSKVPATARAASQKAVSHGKDKDEDAPPATSWQLAEKPDARLDQVAGLDEVKKQLRQRVLDPLNHPGVYDRFKAKAGGGVLMYGPPGNGKTYIARAIAGELDAAFFLVDSAQIKDKYIGETEKKLASLFEEARNQPRSVVFFDEVDDLLSQRGNQKIGTVTTFLKLADGFVKTDGLLLMLAATNKPWMLAPAALRPGRLGTHIYVGPPDKTARQAILEFNFKDVPTEGVDFAAAAGQTEKYSGAELTEVCTKAKFLAIGRQIATGQDQAVTAADMKAAIEGVPPQTSEQQLKDFERWQYSTNRRERDDDSDE